MPFWSASDPARTTRPSALQRRPVGQLELDAHVEAERQLPRVGDLDAAAARRRASSSRRRSSRRRPRTRHRRGARRCGRTRGAGCARRRRSARSSASRAFCAVSTPPKRWMPRPDITSTASSWPTRRLMRSSLTASATVTLEASLRSIVAGSVPMCTLRTTIVLARRRARGRRSSASSGKQLLRPARPGRRGSRRRASRRRRAAGRRPARARAARPGARSRRCA